MAKEKEPIRIMRNVDFSNCIERALEEVRFLNEKVLPQARCKYVGVKLKVSLLAMEAREVGELGKNLQYREHMTFDGNKVVLNMESFMSWYKTTPIGASFEEEYKKLRSMSREERGNLLITR